MWPESHRWFIVNHRIVFDNLHPRWLTRLAIAGRGIYQEDRWFFQAARERLGY